MSETTSQASAPSSSLAPFVHQPRPAEVPEVREHSNQRYFVGQIGDRLPRPATGKSITNWSGASTRVWRRAMDDAARLEVIVTSPHGESTTEINLTPAELRDLAQRLLDAAHDIEALPAALLLAEQGDEVAA